MSLRDDISHSSRTTIRSLKYWVGQRVHSVLSKNRRHFSLSPTLLNNVFLNRTNFLANPTELPLTMPSFHLDLFFCFHKDVTREREQTFQQHWTGLRLQLLEILCATQATKQGDQVWSGEKGAQGQTPSHANMVFWEVEGQRWWTREGAEKIRGCSCRFSFWGVSSKPTNVRQ